MMCFRPAVALVALSVVLASVGCSEPSSAPSPDATSAPTPKLSRSACIGIEDAARAAELPTITSNLGCKEASDCVQVRFAASCFESCYATIATSGLPALQAAHDAVEAAQCVPYHDGGCSLILPPCGARYHPDVYCTRGTCSSVPD